MTDYCTQDDIEKYLDTTFDSNPDPSVSLIISHVSALIDAYCNRDFTLHENVVEYYDGKGKGHNVIMLKNYPVTAVSEVVEDGTTLTENTHYVWFRDGRLVKVSNGYVDPNKWYWKAKVKAVKVTYSYGYSTVPTEIKTICIQLCVEWLKKYPLKHAEAGIASSISLNGVNISYETPETLPEWAKTRLNKYKKNLHY